MLNGFGNCLARKTIPQTIQWNLSFSNMKDKGVSHGSEIGADYNLCLQDSPFRFNCIQIGGIIQLAPNQRKEFNRVWVLQALIEALIACQCAAAWRSPNVKRILSSLCAQPPAPLWLKTLRIRRPYLTTERWRLAQRKRRYISTSHPKFCSNFTLRLRKNRST